MNTPTNTKHSDIADETLKSGKGTCSINDRKSGRPLFPLGKLVATPGAIELLRSNYLSPLDFVRRHCQGDWGCVNAEDQEANDTALIDGTRLFSAYRIGTEKLWIITEANRSYTTLLLPEEY